MKAKCPACGRTVATYVPAKGDGTARYFYGHGPKTKRCPEYEVPGWEVGRTWQTKAPTRGEEIK